MDMRVGHMDAPRVEAAASAQPARPDAAILLVLLAAASAAVAIQSLWVPVDADVSWLITVCERVLGGDRLYVDILEVNPPASVWMYLPLVWAATLAGIRPEALVVAAFIAVSIVSVLATVRIAMRLDDAPRPLWLAAGLSAILLVMPMALFAQREHLALILALPALTALAAIAEGKRFGATATFASGVAAGLIVVIKPYFLLAVLAPALFVAWKRRSLAPILPGIVGGVLAIATYGAAVLLLAQEYLQLLPVIARTYAPMHETVLKLAIGPALYPAICAGLVLLLRPPRVPAVAVLWFIGAAGFLFAAYLQAKNYPNHWLPQAGLAMAAAVAVLAVPGIARSRRRVVAVALGVVALAVMRHWTIVPDPQVAAQIERFAPKRPKIIALSPGLVTGHPVTRNVDGRWVGSRAALFTAAGARFVGLGDPAVRSDYRSDILSFATDVERHRPDVILVQSDSKSWLMREEEIARTMQGYRFEAGTGETEIWVPRESAR